MAQLFPKNSNLISRYSIVGGAAALAIFGLLGMIVVNSSYVTKVKVPRNQPVPFSHEHHVQGLGIDCRYCHQTVEVGSSAGMPASETCMTCHSQIWKDSPMLEPVRESFRTGKAIPWTRVHDLPDYVYFNHSIHVQKGIGCVSCHGKVNQMPLMYQQNTLYMRWCLECHRAPEKAVQPKSTVFNLDFDPKSQTVEARAKLAKANHLRSVTDCSACHR